MTSRQPSCITTPIYYPPGKFHTGSTYTTTAYDVLARYKCVINHEAFYLTGFDEYGQKTRQKAEEAGIAPQAYANGMAVGVKRLWEILEIPHDKFIYTIDDYREKVVVDVFEKLLAQGDIYLGEYSGWYSVPNGEFFTESQLEEAFRDENGKIIGGIAPSGHEVEWVSEKPYFLCLGKYADRLVESFHTHPDFTQPGDRMNEIIRNFIELGLKDLAVSRTSLTWGVKVFSDPKHVVYMWIDALFNYATALGCGQEERTSSDRF